MSKSKITALVLVLFVFVMVAGVVIFKTGIIKAKGSDDCLACHEDKTLTMDAGGKKKSLFIDGASFKKSTHNGTDCKDCHEGYNPEEIPHSKSKVKVSCSTCHDKVKSLDNSVHKGKDCSGCHNPHYQVPAKEMKANQTTECLKCQC